MRLLLVTGSLTPDLCGVGDYTHQLATALAHDAGTEVAVLTSAKIATASSGVDRNYALLPPMNGWTLGQIGQLYRTIKAWRPDVVHIQSPTQGYADGWLASVAAPIAVLAGARVVRTWHEGFAKERVFRLLVELIAPGPYIVVRPEFDRYVSRVLRPLIARRRRVLSLSASAIPRSRLDHRSLTACRAALLAGAERLIVYFGFLYPAKGVERLFALADPATDRLVIVGEDKVDLDYTRTIRALADSPRWRDRTTITGNLPAERVADVLASADVVVLPFLAGGGVWNTSLHAAITQGTPVVTTTADGGAGLESDLIKYVPVGDDAALAAAMRAIPPWQAGRIPTGDDGWARIAREHHEVYRSLTRGLA